MPFILRGLTCTFPGGRKTGIVGRTGSGKSTIIQTIFRIIEPTVGHVFIDGIDISTIGLHDLRSRLSIIPQDPVKFKGTVRNNLDPLEECTDEEIWKVLRLTNAYCCHLLDDYLKSHFISMYFLVIMSFVGFGLLPIGEEIRKKELNLNSKGMLPFIMVIN